MTYEQYKVIMDCYLDFYPDDKIDIVPCPELKEALDMEAEENTDSINLQSTIDSINDSSNVPLEVTIHHPELTITNDYGSTYLLRDVYVRILFPTMQIQIARITYTPEEIACGYIHSHVQKANFNSFSGFCTGGGPINTIIDRIKREKDSSEEFKNSIMSFIIDTERMIRIESNAGGPYISFNSVGVQYEEKPIFIEYSRYIGSRCQPKAMEKFMDFIEYYCLLGLDEFYYDGRNWQLKADDAEFIRRVTRVASTYRKTKNYNTTNIYKWVYEKDGLYYPPSSQPLFHLNCPTTAWAWKGQTLHINVIGQENSSGKGVYIVAPEYLSMLYTFLLNLINGANINGEKYKDCLQSRAYKVKDALVRTL